ncbi:TPA: hypothetical protein OTX98_003350 [Klebsiella aerogenes]|nr:hypothetical protein [Klebsiella aerogenes]
MNKLTLEQLRALAVKKVEALKFSITQSAYTGIRCRLEEELQLAEFALAAMDSEPVIIVGDDSGDALSYRRLLQSFAPGTKLYRHAQPAPVVPNERDKTVDADDHPLTWSFNEGWNACRAAMLQAGNSPAIPDGYVMVPKVPTRDILDEFDSIIDYGAEDSVDAWRRLLAAAPKEVK